VADFQLKVTAETQNAEKDIKRLDKTVNEATKARKISIDFAELNKSFRDVNKNVKEAGNTIKTFYNVSKSIPGIGERVREVEGLAKGTANLARSAPAAAAALRENAKAGSILSNSFEAAGGAANTLIGNLARAGFALFAVQQAVGALRSAFGGFFNETIGREIQLRETILKTQTTLASTNKVFRGGKEITDPYQKIVSLTGEIGKRIDSIRERSIALAGVTSNDVIEVFGIVASQIGQVGGGLKEAENLAINFAAALGTFGIPLYQARQEIGSILRGDITMDSYLAKSLGITNKDIAEAKTKAGGVIKFLEERLAAAVAGQRIAAQGFSGVVSNLKDLSELVSQRFGAGLLDPLLGGLTRVFDFLFKIREEVFAIASGMGRGVGQLLSTNLTAIGGGSALFAQLGSGAEGFAAQLAESVKRAFASLQADANAFVAPVRNILEELTKSFAAISKGLSVLAKGFVSINIENFKALVSVFSNLTEAITLFSAGLGQVLRAYGQLLQVPFVQYLSQLSVQFKLLEQLGVVAAIKFALVAGTLISTWTPIVTFVQGLVARIAALIGGLVLAVGAALTRIGVIIASFAATLSTTYPAVAALQAQLIGLAASFTAAGGSAERAGVSVAKFGGATTAAARLAGTAILNFIKFSALLLAIQVGITLLVDSFGRYQRAQEEAAQSTRAAQALELLRTKYKDVTEASDSATKAARDYNRALVDANYQKNLDALEQVREKINQIRYELKPGIQSWREFWSALSGSEIGRFEEGSRQQLQGLLKDEQNYRNQLRAVDADRDRRSAEERITLEANKRTDLEKEIAAFRRAQENELFQQRQTLAQKEVEIFRAAGELRIFQMEQANQKLIEGEEGASRAALESLNNYLSVRERGELEIEAAKQNLAVEVANMERSILNYRLDMEKKIFDLRKRAGENDIASAKAREQMAGASFSSLSEIIGSRESYGGDYTAFNRGGYAQGHRAIGSGKDPNLTNMTIAEIQRRQLAPGVAKNQQLHAVGKYQIIGTTLQSLLQGKYGNTGVKSSDKFTPEIQEVLGSALARARIVPGSVNETMAGLRAEWVGLQNVPTKDLLPAVKELMAGGSAAAPRVSTAATPQLQGRSDIGDGKREAEEYAAAVRAVSTAMERLRILQKALTDAKSKEALEAIAKAAFTPVALEQYQDQLAEVQLTYEALAASSSETFDPERSKIEIDTLVKLKAAARELSQIEMAINASSLLSAQEKKRVMVAIGEQHTKYVDSLESEETALKSIQAVQRGTDAIQRLRTDTADIYKELEVTKYQNRLESEGVAPERIAAEVEKLRLKQWMTQEQTRLNEALEEQRKLLDELQKREKPKNEKDKADLQRRLDEALATIKKLQEQLGQLPKEGQKKADAIDAKAGEVQDPVESLIGRWKRELTDTKAMVASLAQTIQSELGSAMSNAVSGVINGTMTVQEAFGQMFANIGRAFIEMATQMIAKALILQVLGLFAGGTPSALVKGVDVPMAQMPAGMQFRASGGPISAGRPYIVGERGPELVFPGADGYVLPADRTAAALAQSRAALGGGGSSAAGSNAFSENRDALSTATSMSRERQVERWLTSGASSTEIKYSRVGAGDLPFVTEQDMLQATRLAAQEGARMGQQRTMAALKNNPGARRTIGI
jgi:hypothetical protein